MKNHNPYIAGVPDVWYSGEFRDLWVEYKYVERTPSKDVVVLADLSALQRTWLTARHNEGRNVAVIIGFANHAAISQIPREWLTGISIHAPLEKQEVAAWINEFCLGG